MAILNNLLVNGASRFLGHVYIQDLDVAGITNFGTLAATDITASGTLAVTGATTLSSTLSVSGTATFAKTTDLSGTANNSPALIVGGTASQAHIEIDSNEIQGKGSGTTTADLYINNDGGKVNLGKSGLVNVTNNGTTSTLTTPILSATDGNIANAVISNARVTDELIVDGVLETNEMRTNIIKAVGGQLYVAPTFVATNSTTIVCTAVTTSTVSFTITDSTAINSLTYGGANWNNGSKLKFTAKITSNNIATNPPVITFSSAEGTLTSNMNATSGKLTLTVDYDGASTYFKVAASTNLTYSDMSVMMYQIKSGNDYFPVGIYIKSYGTDNKNSYIDVYGGTTAFPNARLGLLNGLKDPDDPTADLTINGTTVSGWGLMSSYAYLKGRIVSKSGTIGGWDIGNTTLTSGTLGTNNSMWLTTANVPTATKFAGAASALSNWRVGVGSKFGVLDDGTMYCSNAIISGELNANTGTFGGSSGFTIATNKLYSNGKSLSTSTNNGIYIQSGSSGGIYLGSYDSNKGSCPFQVTAEGVLTSRSGTIGGWTLSDNALYNGTFGLNNSVMMSTGYISDRIYIGGSRDLSIPWAFVAGNNFGVSIDGSLYATNGKFSGNISSGAGDIGGWKIAMNQLLSQGSDSRFVIKNASIKMIDISELTVTGCDIVFNGDELEITKTASTSTIEIQLPQEYILKNGRYSVEGYKNNVIRVVNCIYLKPQTVDGNTIYVPQIEAFSEPTYQGYIPPIREYSETLFTQDGTVYGPVTIKYSIAGDIGETYILTSSIFVNDNIHVTVTDNSYTVGYNTGLYEDIAIGCDVLSNNTYTTPLYMTNTGLLHAENLDCTGGTIGGWHILDGCLYSQSDNKTVVLQTSRKIIDLIDNNDNTYTLKTSYDGNVLVHFLYVGDLAGYNIEFSTTYSNGDLSASGGGETPDGGTYEFFMENPSEHQQEPDMNYHFSESEHTSDFHLYISFPTAVANTPYTISVDVSKNGASVPLDSVVQGSGEIVHTSEEEELIVDGLPANAILGIKKEDNNNIEVPLYITDKGELYAENAIIGANSKAHLTISNDALDMYYNNSSILHFGYGDGTNASGTTSKAPYYSIGIRNGTVGNYSVTAGDGSTASGYASFAVGDRSTASGYASFAAGYKSTASGDYSVAIGDAATAAGKYSVAIGKHTSTNNYLYSFAMGNYTKANASASFAMGDYVTTTGFASVAMGKYTSANGGNSCAIGSHIITSSNYNTAIGKYNEAVRTGSGTDASPYVYSAPDYSFAIGNGTGDATADRSNALTVDWNGNLVASGSVTGTNIVASGSVSDADGSLGVKVVDHGFVVQTGSGNNGTGTFTLSSAESSGYLTTNIVQIWPMGTWTNANATVAQIARSGSQITVTLASMSAQQYSVVAQVLYRG